MQVGVLQLKMPGRDGRLILDLIGDNNYKQVRTWPKLEKAKLKYIYLYVNIANTWRFDTLVGKLWGFHFNKPMY